MMKKLLLCTAVFGLLHCAGPKQNVQDDSSPAPASVATTEPLSPIQAMNEERSLTPEKAEERIKQLQGKLTADDCLPCENWNSCNNAFYDDIYIPGKDDEQKQSKHDCGKEFLNARWCLRGKMNLLEWKDMCRKDYQALMKYYPRPENP